MSEDVSRISSQNESGDLSAAEQLLPLVYDELVKLRYFAGLTIELAAQALGVAALRRARTGFRAGYFWKALVWLNGFGIYPKFWRFDRKVRSRISHCLMEHAQAANESARLGAGRENLHGKVTGPRS